MDVRLGEEGGIRPVAAPILHYQQDGGVELTQGSSLSNILDCRRRVLNGREATFRYTERHRLAFVFLVVAVDLTAFGGFIGIALGNLGGGMGSSSLVAITYTAVFGFVSRNVRAYDASAPAALRIAAGGMLQLGLLATLVIGGAGWCTNRLAGEQIVVVGAASSLLAAAARLLCLSIGSCDKRWSRERLLLVGSAQALNRISASGTPIVRLCSWLHYGRGPEFDSHSAMRAHRALVRLTGPMTMNYITACLATSSV